MARTERELLVRDSKRAIGKELLQAIRDVKAGRHCDCYQVKTNEVLATRVRTRLSQG